MDINELQSFRLSDAVKFHDKLNPALWTKQGKLQPQVQKQLLVIAQDFIDYLGLSDLKVKDITISGSNAAYSYTPHSDIDLHILVDFKDLPNDEVYQELFNSKKTLYNDIHEITVHGVPVELYVQDTNQKHTSLGEYSVLNNDWVKFPIKRRANLSQTNTKLKYEKLGEMIELAIESRDFEKIKKVLDILKRYRKSGLEKTGEFGPENLAYKLVRQQGLLQRLIDVRNELHSERLSIEEQLDVPTPTIENLLSKYGEKLVMNQLRTGIKTELEHTNDIKTAMKIALAHLGENIYYYTLLSKAGLEESAKGFLKEFAPSNGDDSYYQEYMRGYKDGTGYPKMVKSSKKKEIWMTATPKNPPLTKPYLQGWHDAKYGPSSNKNLIDLDKLNEQSVAEGGDETSWSDGNEKVTLQDILELTKHVKQIDLPINDNLKSKLIHWDGNPEEIERINQVTVSNQFPILVMLDAQGQIDWILDGNHRLHKAIRSQAKTIPAKLIKPSDLNDKTKRVFHIKEYHTQPSFMRVDFDKETRSWPQKRKYYKKMDPAILGLMKNVTPYIKKDENGRTIIQLIVVGSALYSTWKGISVSMTGPLDNLGVKENEEMVVGIFSAWPVDPSSVNLRDLENLRSAVVNGTSIENPFLFIRDDYHAQGIGTKIMSWYLQNHNAVFARDQHTRAAKNLWDALEKMGFKSVYYHSAENRAVPAKTKKQRKTLAHGDIWRMIGKPQLFRDTQSQAK